MLRAACACVCVYNQRITSSGAELSDTVKKKTHVDCMWSVGEPIARAGLWRVWLTEIFKSAFLIAPGLRKIDDTKTV